VGTEFEAVMCKNGKWWSKCEKQGVLVKVGAESEVAMCENRNWLSKWVQNLKWPCVKMENSGQSG
jgi:hypothetical protein